MQIGGLCRVMGTIQDVARLMHLHWHAVRDFDKIYMREQLRVAGDQKSRIIGIDEISIKKDIPIASSSAILLRAAALLHGGFERRDCAVVELFYAMLTKSACPSLRIRLRALIAMATSVARRASSRDFKVFSMTRL